MSYNGSQGVYNPIGSTVGFSNTSTGTFVPIATEITDLTLPTFSLENIETTNSSTTTYPAPEGKPGIGKYTAGEVTANLTYADYKAAQAALNTGAVDYWKWISATSAGASPTGMTTTHQGYIQELLGKQPILKGMSTMTIKIMPTTVPVSV
jgi:hypothetical protein